MSIQFIDKNHLASVIIDAWQNYLNTEMDPVDGQWFNNGPENNGGLYGHLTDTIATELVFNLEKKVFQVHQKAVATSVADNRNGLTPNMSTTLTYAYQNVTTTSYTKSNSIKIGTGLSITSKANFLGSEVGVTTSMSTEYSHTWSETTSSSRSETLQFSENIPVTIPSGHVIKVCLMCNTQQLQVPYFADIVLTGCSTANFRSPVNGKKTWQTDAGSLCEWIEKYQSNSDGNLIFCRDPNNSEKGLIRVKGMLDATSTVNFSVLTEDITQSFNGRLPDGWKMAKTITA